MDVLSMYPRILVLTVATMLAAVAQSSGTRDTLACVAVKSEPIIYQGISMVDVELTNHCSDDITAYAVGLSDRVGSEPVRLTERSNLLNLLVFGEPGATRDPYHPNDVLRNGKAIRFRLAVPRHTPKYLGEVSVMALVFLGTNAIGDSEVIRSIRDDRKQYLQGLVSARGQLGDFGDLASAKARLRERARPTTEVPDAGRISTSERVVKNEMNQLGQYAGFAKSEEDWRRYIAGKFKKLDLMIDLYTKHSQLELHDNTR